MNEITEIENYVIKEFQFLETVLGISDPIVTRTKWITKILYPSILIGFEIELDWRDVDIFLLIVRLKNGKLVKETFLSNSEEFSIHIEFLIEKLFNEKYYPNNSTQRRTDKDFYKFLIDRTSFYKEIVEKYGQKILSQSEKIFIG